MKQIKNKHAIIFHTFLFTFSDRPDSLYMLNREHKWRESWEPSPNEGMN